MFAPLKWKNVRALCGVPVVAKWGREEVISLTGWWAGLFSAFSADCLRRRECCTVCTGGNRDKKGGKIQWGGRRKEGFVFVVLVRNSVNSRVHSSAVYYLLRNLKFHMIFFFFVLAFRCTWAVPTSPAHFIIFFFNILLILWVYNWLGPSQAALWLTWACLCHLSSQAVLFGGM